MKHSNNMLTMEERNVKISIDKAREWYKQGGELKELDRLNKKLYYN